MNKNNDKVEGETERSEDKHTNDKKGEAKENKNRDGETILLLLHFLCVYWSTFIFRNLQMENIKIQIDPVRKLLYSYIRFHVVASAPAQNKFLYTDKW